MKLKLFEEMEGVMKPHNVESMEVGQLVVISTCPGGHGHIIPGDEAHSFGKKIDLAWDEYMVGALVEVRTEYSQAPDWHKGFGTLRKFLTVMGVAHIWSSLNYDYSILPFTPDVGDWLLKRCYRNEETGIYRLKNYDGIQGPVVPLTPELK